MSGASQRARARALGRKESRVSVPRAPAAEFAGAPASKRVAPGLVALTARLDDPTGLQRWPREDMTRRLERGYVARPGWCQRSRMLIRLAFVMAAARQVVRILPVRWTGLCNRAWKETGCCSEGWAVKGKRGLSADPDLRVFLLPGTSSPSSSIP